MKRALIILFFLILFFAGCLQQASQSRDIIGSLCVKNSIIQAGASCTDKRYFELSPSLKNIIGDKTCTLSSIECNQAEVNENLLCNVTLDIDGNMNKYENISICGSILEGSICGAGCRVVACSYDLFKRATKEPPSVLSPADTAEGKVRNITEVLNATFGEKINRLYNISASGSALYSLMGKACSLFEISKENYPFLTDPKTRILSFRIGVSGYDSFKTLSAYTPFSSEQCSINLAGFVDAMTSYYFKNPNNCRVVYFNGSAIKPLLNAAQNSIAEDLNENYFYMYNCTTGKNAGKIFSRYIDCELSCLSDGQVNTPYKGNIVYPSEDVCKYGQLTGQSLAREFLNYSNVINQSYKIGTKDLSSLLTDIFRAHPDMSVSKSSFEQGGYRMGALPFECTSNIECLSGFCDFSLHNRVTLVNSSGLYNYMEFITSPEGSSQGPPPVLSAFQHLIGNPGCWLTETNTNTGSEGPLTCVPNMPVSYRDKVFTTRQEYFNAVSNQQISCIKRVVETTSMTNPLFFPSYYIDDYGFHPKTPDVVSYTVLAPEYNDYLGLFFNSTAFGNNQDLPNASAGRWAWGMDLTYYKFDRCSYTEGNSIKAKTVFKKISNGPMAGMGMVAIPIDSNTAVLGDTLFPIFGYPDVPSYFTYDVGEMAKTVTFYDYPFDDVDTLLASAKLSTSAYRDVSFFGSVSRMYPFIYNNSINFYYYYPITDLNWGFSEAFVAFRNVSPNWLCRAGWDIPGPRGYENSTMIANSTACLGINGDRIDTDPLVQARYFDLRYRSHRQAFIERMGGKDRICNLVPGEDRQPNCRDSIDRFINNGGDEIILGNSNDYTDIAFRIKTGGAVCCTGTAADCADFKGIISIPGDRIMIEVSWTHDAGGLGQDYTKRQCIPNASNGEYLYRVSALASDIDPYYSYVAGSSSDSNYYLVKVQPGIIYSYQYEHFGDIGNGSYGKHNGDNPPNVIIDDETYINIDGMTGYGYRAICGPHYDIYNLGLPNAFMYSRENFAHQSNCISLGTINNEPFVYMPFSFITYNDTAPMKLGPLNPYRLGVYGFKVTNPKTSPRVRWVPVAPVEKTFPEFFQDLDKLNENINYELSYSDYAGGFQLGRVCNIKNYMPNKNIGGAKATYYSGVTPTTTSSTVPESSTDPVYRDNSLQVVYDPSSKADISGLQQNLPSYIRRVTLKNNGNYYIEAYVCFNPYVLSAQGTSSIAPGFYYPPSTFINSAYGPLIDRYIFLEPPCDQLTIKDYCMDADCSEMYTSMAVFVYNHSAARIETPFGNYSTFGDCLVDDNGNLVKSNVGACQSCSFINAYEDSRDNNNIQPGQVQSALDMGALPILTNYVPSSPLDYSVRGGPTGIFLTDYNNAKTTKDNCPECMILTNNPSQLLIGTFGPIFPTLLYDTSVITATINSGDVLRATFDALNNSQLAGMARAWKVPAILKLDISSTIFTNPAYWLNFSANYRDDLVNAGIGGIIISGNLDTIITNFCAYEKSFRTLTGREVSYVLGRKPVVPNETLYQAERPFEVKNKRSLSSIPQSLCVNASWFYNNNYSVVCYTKSQDNKLIVRSLSPGNATQYFNDTLLYDVYAPIIGSVSRNSGIYTCKYAYNETGGAVPLYTYDLVPSTDIFGEAPILVPNDTNVACFQEPLRQIDILRLTGQTLENLNCYARKGCCRDTMDIEGDPAKYICENELNGYYNESSGLCYWQTINVSCNYATNINCWNNTRLIPQCTLASTNQECWNTVIQANSFTRDLYGNFFPYPNDFYQFYLQQLSITNETLNIYDALGSSHPNNNYLYIGPTLATQSDGAISYNPPIYFESSNAVNDSARQRFQQLNNYILSRLQSLGSIGAFETYNNLSTFNTNLGNKWTGYYNNIYINVKWCPAGYQNSDLRFNQNAPFKQRVTGNLCFKDLKTLEQLCPGTEHGYSRVIRSGSNNYCGSDIKSPKYICENERNGQGLWISRNPNDPDWIGTCYNRGNPKTAEELLCPSTTTCPSPVITQPPQQPKQRPDIVISLGEEQIEGTGGAITGEQQGGGEGAENRPNIELEII
ncbi:MAG: hypothetical protein QXP22_03790 [Candidatus Anstonellales archaeon]